MKENNAASIHRMEGYSKTLAVVRQSREMVSCREVQEPKIPYNSLLLLLKVCTVALTGHIHQPIKALLSTLGSSNNQRSSCPEKQFDLDQETIK